MARKKSKFHWKKTKAGCRCVRSSDKFVKAAKCKGLRKSVCAKKRRKAPAAAMPPVAPGMPGVPFVPPGYDIDVPGWAPITAEAQAQALSGYYRPRRRRRMRRR